MTLWVVLLFVLSSQCLGDLSPSNCADCERFITSMISLTADAYPTHLGDPRDADTQLCAQLPEDLSAGCARAVGAYGLRNVEAVAATNPGRLCAMVESCRARSDSLAFLSLDGEDKHEDEDEEETDGDKDENEDDGDEEEEEEEAESFLAELKKKGEKKPAENGDDEDDEDDDDEENDDEDEGDAAFLETYRKKKGARKSEGKSKAESELDRAAREGIQLGAMGMMNSPLLSAGQSNFNDALDEMGGEANEGRGPGCCNMPSRTPEEMQEMMGGDSQLQAIVSMPMAMMQNPGDPTSMMMQLGF